MKKILMILSAALIFICLTGCSNNIAPDTMEMKAICKLAVYDCYYYDVEKYDKADEDGFWIFAKNKKFWAECSAKVTYGIDAEDMVIDVNENEVTITLPEAEIISCGIVSGSFHTYEYPDSAKITVEDVSTATADIQEKLKEKAESDQNMLSNARSRAQQLLENYIKNIGDQTGTEYKIIWKDLDAQSSEDAE